MNRVAVFLLVAVALAASVSANRGYNRHAGHKKNVPSVLISKIQHHIKSRAITLGADVDGNAYVDDVLKSVDSQIKADGDDPYTVYSIEVLGVGLAGYIGGFSTLHRIDDAVVTQTETELDIVVSIGVVNLDGVFNWTIPWLFGYNGMADALVDEVTTTMSLHGDILAGATSVVLQLDEFDIPEIGRISVEVSGLGPLDPYVDDIVNAVVNLFSGLIPTFFDGIIKVVLESVIDNYPCPLPA